MLKLKRGNPPRAPLSQLKIFKKELLVSPNSKRCMPQDPVVAKPLKPLLEVRKAFCKARRLHYRSRRKIADQMIQAIQVSRKHAPSRNLRDTLA